VDIVAEGPNEEDTTSDVNRRPVVKSPLTNDVLTILSKATTVLMIVKAPSPICSRVFPAELKI